ncbi:MAG: hypothetical protein Q7R96_02620 [Nanoarchaeota archaeon]|nr:hypothetical protein [Nanoarchaeota archaeon]
MTRFRVAVISVLLLASVIFFVHPQLTGFAVVQLRDPSFVLNLSSFDYQPGDVVQGNIIINFSSPVQSDLLVQLSLANVSQERSLAVLLDDSAIQNVVIPRAEQTTNPTAVKSLTFLDKGDQAVVLRLPKNADVKSFSIHVEGDQIDGSYPAAPYLDIGADGFKEWVYHGAMSGFSSNISYPEGFSFAAESSVIVKDDGRLYCEVFNLSEAKDFEVLAKFGPYGSDTGDMQAVLLSFSGAGSAVSAAGGTDVCDIPESSSMNVSSCRLSLSSVVAGKYLVCVTNAQRDNLGKNVYSLVTDQASSTSSYTCGYFVNAGTCTAVSNGHFYLGVRSAVYASRLNREVSLSDGATQFDAVQALKKFLVNCPAVDGLCAVPLVVGSNAKGKVYLSQVVIQYVSQGLDREEKSFYDTTTQPSYFQSVNGVNLSSNTVGVSIPLSKFSLAVPVDGLGALPLRLSLQGRVKANASIVVEKAVSPNATLARIDRVKSSLLALDKNLLVRFDLQSSVNAVFSSLDRLKLRLSNISRAVDEQVELEAIKSDLDVALADVPRSIALVKEVRDVVLSSAQDFSGFDNADALAAVQRAYTVEGVVKVYAVESFSGTKMFFSVVEKSIRGNLQGVEELVEILPAGSDAVFDRSVQKSNGRVSLVPANSFSYVVDGDIASSLASLKTLVVAESKITKEVAAVPVVCGDNKCTSVRINGELITLEDALTCPVDCKKKVPYTIFVIVGVLVILGIVYFHFYRGPGAAFKTVKKEGLFKNKVDEDNLKNYVRTTLDRKVARDKVEPILLAKGWNKKQVAFVYEEMSKSVKKK